MAVKRVRHGTRDGPDAEVTEIGSGGPACCSFSVTSIPGLDGEILVLQVAGDIDLSSQPALQTALTDCLDATPRHLVIDLSALNFCGVRGFTLLADIGSAAADGRTAYVVSGLPSGLDRIASMLWEDGKPTRHRTVASAVTAIRAGQAAGKAVHDPVPL